MKEATSTRTPPIAVLSALVLLVLFSIQGKAQTLASQNPPAQAQGQSQLPPTQLVQMLDQLNLTPDQIQRIRAINMELKDQRQAANQRLRQAQRALTDAVESPSPDEKLIEQRSHEVADAQAGTIRLRSLTEARVRQVLTPEQLDKVRQIQEKNREFIRQQRQQNNQRPRVGPQGGLRRNPNLGSKLGPNPKKSPSPKP
jgi:Spy/CpxP family protein refolding chaperone